jgi:hypothetical protein
MAGSWKEIFPFSLTWHEGFLEESTTEVEASSHGVREAVTVAAPSWSSFSVPIFLRHEHEFH